MSWLGAVQWLLHVALGGGLLLLLTWLAVRRVRQPARQQRLAEWGVGAALLLAALCLAPAWLLIPLPIESPVPGEGVRVESRAREKAETPADDREAAGAAEPSPAPVERQEWVTEAPMGGQPGPAGAAPSPQRSAGTAGQGGEAGTVPAPAAVPARLTAEGLAAGVVCLYLAGVAWFLGRLAWGYCRLARCLRLARPAPEEVRRLWEAMVPGPRRPRLLVSPQVRVPLSCGLLRPAVVLPEALCWPDAGTRLRWVLAHELSHLRRRDAVACLLFGLAQAVYYFVPWLWRLRRQVRLCQEYVADAAAAREAGPAADYAEFLLSWSIAPALPAGATGVSGHTSDLFRRIAMLVKSPMEVEQRCPRRWSLLAAAGLLSLAVVGAGVGLRAVAAPAPEAEKKDETKKDRDATKQDKKDAQKKDAEKKDAEKKARPRFPGLEGMPPDFEEMLKRLPADLPPAQREMMRKQLEHMRRMMEEMRKQFPGGGLQPQFPQFQPFPPFPGGPGFGFARPSGVRLGVRLEKPNATMVDQLDLPRGQGLVIQDVMEGSAAAKAGLKKHDILLELGGRPVPDDLNQFVRMLKDVKAGTPVDAVVLRKGKKETVKGLTLPEAKETRPFQGNFQVPNFQLPDFPFPGGVPGGFGGKGGITTLSRSKDSFTARHQKGDLVITVTGKLAGGKAVVSEVKVQDGGKTETYDSVDRVPEAHRAKVQELAEMAGKGGARFPFGRPGRRAEF